MARSNETTTKFKADISQLKASMQEAARQVRLANSEFKAATAGMENWAKSTDGLNAKVKQLNSVLNAQKAQLSSLEKQYALVAKEQGEDSKGAQELAIKINYQKAAIGNTQAALSKYEGELANAGKGTKELDDELKAVGNDSSKASDGFTVMKGALSSLVADGVRVALNGVKQLGAAFVNVGKQAIASYAEFEQLEGGVEKIFGKNAAKTVKKNADDAFKSAGMSANEYMGTVTKFSASLIKGLGGDTKAAAKYADVAIKDMSDNANSFGTDMESIQNAYQGFAKQNFSMLDNLNLGYGGSAQGMVELVKDSGILGKAADDLTNKNLKEKVSFDQMIQAIHITQQRLKITGTTSAEASKTIEGSTNAMKASWQNLLTGIADDNADFGTLIDNFSKSLQAMLGNMLPRIKVAIQGIGQLVSQLLPELVGMVVTELPGLVSTLLPAVISTIQTLISGIVTALPSLLTVLSNSLPGILTNALNLAPQLLSVLTGAITQVLTTLSGMLPTLLQQFTAILPQLFSQLSSAIPQILSQLMSMVPTLVNSLISLTPLILSGVMQIVMSIVDYLPEALNLIISSLPDLISNLVSSIISMSDMLIQALISIVNILVPQLPGLISQLVESLITLAPVLLDGAMQLFMSIVRALPLILPPLLQMLPNIISSLLDTLIQATPLLLDSAIEFFMALVDALPEVLEILIPMIPEITVKVISELIKSAPKLLKAAFTLFIGIHKAILKVMGKILSELPAIGKSIIDGLGKALSKVADIGSDLVKGLWNGIKDMTGWIKDKIEGFGSSVVDGLKDFFGIHSPSTLMRDEIGKWLGPGIVAGVVATESKTIKALKASANRTMKGYMAGFVGGLVSSSRAISATASGLISGVVGTLLKGGFDFSNVSKKASEGFATQLEAEGATLTRRMEFQQNERINALDSELKATEALRDKKLAQAKAQNDKAIKDIEKERDKEISELERIRDAKLKSISRSNASDTANSKVKRLEKNRDATVEKLEKERDKKLEALQDKLDKAKDDKKKKKLKSEISDIKKNYKERIDQTKKSAKEEIEAVKDSNDKRSKVEKEAAEDIKAYYDKQIEQTKKNATKQINQIKKNDKQITKNITKQYEKLIQKQTKARDDYKTSSEAMIKQFSSALSDYQKKAEELVDSVINGITDEYQARYDVLIDKQEGFIDTLKQSQELFNISSAGVMTINDPKKATEEFIRYAEKLKTIKAKVSSDMFDEILKLDMKEGNAYVDRLLAMDDAALKEYVDAYEEKNRTAEELSDELFQSDYDSLATQYAAAIGEAFEGLPEQLATLGAETMQGFVQGMEGEKEFLTTSVNKIINSLIGTFKSELGIASPSKVLAKIGEFTGEGFAEGLKSTMSTINRTVNGIISSTASSFDSITTDLGSAKSGIGGSSISNTNVTNNYNLVQNNTSPKALSALETYQARRQQIAMVKAFTS